MYDRWPKMPMDEHRKIAEKLCQKIVIGDGKVDVTFTDKNSSVELFNNLTRL